jgi:hypothetical protein
MAPTLTSTTSTKEEMEHALSENWRETPITPDAPAKTPEPEVEASETEETPVTTAAEPETAETPESEKPKDKPKSKYQRTIDKLTARNHAAETRAEKAERELAEERAKHASGDKTPPAAQPSGPPKLQDFLNAGKTADEWADARDVWKQEQEQKQAQQDQLKTTYDTYNRKVSEARGKYEDWDETVVNNDLEIPASVQLAVIEMDNGPDVAYHLAKHPEICAELLDMTPLSAVRKVGQIAESLNPESRRSHNEKPKPKPPAPLAPVGASSTRSSIPLEQMPPKDYIRIRNEQEARAKGRR